MGRGQPKPAIEMGPLNMLERARFSEIAYATRVGLYIEVLKVRAEARPVGIRLGWRRLNEGGRG
jgi:hypothetical protein